MKNLKTIGKYLISSFKISQFFIVLITAFFLTACIKKVDTPSTNKPPKTIILEKTNLNSDKTISSTKKLILYFDENIAPESVIQANIILLSMDDKKIELTKYQVQQDDKDLKKIYIIFNDELKNNTSKYKLNLQNLKGSSGHKLENTKSLEFTLVDLIAPKFVGSNIFGTNILLGTKKIVLQFSEPLQAVSAIQVSIKKAETLLNADDFTSSLQANQKTLEISFKNPNELDEIKTSYSIEISDKILDLSGNKLENPQTLKLDTLLDKSKTIFITATGAGSKNGDSWANATTLDEALANAQNQQKFLVASGIYYADPAKNDESKTLLLKNTIEIYGGFDINSSNMARNLESSILEGDLGNGKHTNLILKGENLNSATLIDGFIIQNALNTKTNSKGAGLYLINSNPQLQNLFFKNNILRGTNSNGAAIYNNNSHPNIINSNFSNNFAKSNAGAIYNYESNPKISGTNFNKNSTEADGGAIYNRGSKIHINNSKFIENSAKNSGGAIYNSDNSNLTIKTSEFNSNSTQNTSGGAIYNGSKLNVNASNFRANLARNVGGAIHNSVSSSFNIINSNFTENVAKSSGGAISSFSKSEANVSNSNFISNIGKVIGGAFFNFNSNPIITNSILWNNADSHTGEQVTNNIYNINSNPQIKNSILNTDSAATQQANQNNYKITTPYNFMDNSQTQFKENQTPTDFAIELNGKVIDAKSQAKIIDKGKNLFYLEVYDKVNGLENTNQIPSTEKDLAGDARLKDSAIDIGAYELQK